MVKHAYSLKENLFKQADYTWIFWKCKPGYIRVFFTLPIIIYLSNENQEKNKEATGKNERFPQIQKETLT